MLRTNEVKIALLDQLAGIVCDIDENKMKYALIPELTNKALDVIRQLKESKIDIGGLEDVVLNFPCIHGDVRQLPYMLDQAHDEIYRLLGSDAERVYYQEKSQ